jgi:Domain of unknown function (DUF1906)
MGRLVCWQTSMARFRRILVLALAGLACLAFVSAGAALARGRAQRTKVVRYGGLAVRVPSSWPVFDLSRRPQTCVRFDRHALYLGVPGPQEQCPAGAIGRTEAILVAPVTAGIAALRHGSDSSASALGRGATSFVTHGLEVTATWSHDPGVVAAALGRRSLPAPSPAHTPRASDLRPAQSLGGVYTGPGFDTCAAPSSGQMSAWSSSPYRAVGVYIGGENAACSQPNLTPTWVAAQIAAGWHLIPTYVGLQASGACSGCSAITPSKASAEGTSDANTAAQDAESLGIPAGSAIYDDMEAYDRSSSNTSAVLAFLSAWTTELHAQGYDSGVYSSGASGITDLVNKWGTGYAEPDDIWIAQWNGVESTSSSYVPAGDWSNNQRVHQYDGAHNETYGGKTINIDSDYLDANTAGVILPPPLAPSVSVAPTSTGITNVSPSWPRMTGIAYWRVLAGSNPNSLTPVGTWRAPQSRIALHGTSPYFAVEALGQSGQVVGTSPVVGTPAHLALIGKSAYVSATTGAGTLPAGCYIGTACSVVTTIKDGRSTIASTSAESFRANSSGTIRFHLTSGGRSKLLSARDGRLAVTVRMKDASGRAVSVGIDLVPYSANSVAHTGQIARSASVRVVDLNAFVSSGGAGSVLAGCRTVAPCHVTTTVSLGRTVIARPRAGVIGAHEFGYLNISLTSQGRALLARAKGTLAVRVQVAHSTGDAAIARVALVTLG